MNAGRERVLHVKTIYILYFKGNFKLLILEDQEKNYNCKRVSSVIWDWIIREPLEREPAV